MTRLILPLLALLAAAPVAARTFAVTGQNDVTATGIGRCDRSPHSCTTNSTVSGPNGATASRSRLTTGTAGQITSTLTGIDLNGRTTAVTRHGLCLCRHAAVIASQDRPQDPAAEAVNPVARMASGDRLLCRGRSTLLDTACRTRSAATSKTYGNAAAETA